MRYYDSILATVQESVSDEIRIRSLHLNNAAFEKFEEYNHYNIAWKNFWEGK